MHFFFSIICFVLLVSLCHCFKSQFKYANAGNLPLFSSRVSPTPPVDVLVAAGDNTKSHDRYLGRDSFANAAARVGPAVVHISVAQGKLVCFSGWVWGA